MKTLHTVDITPHSISVDGTPIATEGSGAALLRYVYRTYIGGYPKFFKMDALCQLGFVATELLLEKTELRIFDEKGRVPEEQATENRAVVFFNAAASLVSDTCYQNTIADAGNFFPSPAVFVYTLPNIVTGEVAIRNRYYGETAFYMASSANDPLIDEQLELTLQAPQNQSVIGGWLDCTDADTFSAHIKLVTK